MKKTIITASILGLFSLLSTGAMSVYAADIYVDATATGANDGTTATDAFLTIQDAVSAASSTGDTIIINGTQVVTSTITVAKELTLKSGTAGRIETTGGTHIFVTTAPNVTIDGITFVKTDIGTQNMINVQGANTSIINNNFSSQWNIGDAEVVRALEVSTTNGLVIRNNQFTHLRQPAYINDNTTGVIENNYVSDTKGWVVVANTNMTFTGNTFGTNVVDIAFIPGTPNNYTNIPAISAANGNAAIENQATSPATLAHVYVDGSVGVTGNGTQSSPYKTIAEAMTRVADNGTVTVAAGTYAENVAITKPLTLKGANSGTAGNGTRVAETVVDGGSTSAPFAVSANDVTINGFTIKGGVNNLNSGVWSTATNQNLTVTNNVITDNAIGVYAQCANNCTISNNLFDANNQVGSAGGSGIYAENSTNLTISGNEFKNHTQGNPIILASVASPSHTNIVVTNNNFHDNAYSNVYVLSVSNGTFTNNTVTPASDSTGFSFSGGNSDITITGNTITNGQRGIRIEDAGYGIGSNSNFTIRENNLSGNTEYGIGVTAGGYASGTINARLNVWGAASGPATTTNPDGTGSPVIGNEVDFSPWYTDMTKSKIDFLTVDTTVKTATVPEAFTSNGGTLATMELLSGTTLTGTLAWNGEFAFPYTTTTYNVVPGTGFAALNVSAIGLGYSSALVTSDTAVKVTLTGQASSTVGLSGNGFTKITSICDSTTNPTLSSGTACRVNVGADLVVFTKNPTTLVLYTEVIAGGNTGSGTVTSVGGSSGSGTTGQVLGASTSTTQTSTTTTGTPTTGVTGSNGSTSGSGVAGEVLGATAFAFSSNLSFGSRGNDVMELQKYLIAQGHLRLTTPTTYFGTLTRSALIRFQRANNIPATGFFGAITRAFINAQ